MYNRDEIIYSNLSGEMIERKSHKRLSHAIFLKLRMVKWLKYGICEQPLFTDEKSVGSGCFST